MPSSRCEEGDDRDHQDQAAVDEGGGVEAVPVRGEAADQGGDAEGDVADHVGEGEELATFVGMGEGGKYAEGTERRGSEADSGNQGPGKGERGQVEQQADQIDRDSGGQPACREADHGHRLAVTEPIDNHGSGPAECRDHDRAGQVGVILDEARCDRRAQ
ncbi:MAG TPA: hypothetical protein PLO12_11140 [Solirubrobacterales bacterium]|nr:hypothetical protein [Solirubrobacterales bacterium]